jgi:hypothetical protein
MWDSRLSIEGSSTASPAFQLILLRQLRQLPVLLRRLLSPLCQRRQKSIRLRRRIHRSRQRSL